MKKHLIAAAVAAAVAAPAMAQVTVYGLIDGGYATSTIDHGNNVQTKQKAMGGLHSANGTGTLSGSRLGFRGTEDLGGGLKAGFVYELGINYSNGQAATTAPSNTDQTLANGAGFGNVRQGFLELSGGFGAVRVGTHNSLAKDTTESIDPNAGVTLTGAASLYQLGLLATRPDSITYMSPVFNGFSAQAQLDVGETTYSGTVPNDNKGQSFSARYAAGPLLVVASTEARKDNNFAATTTNLVSLSSGSVVSPVQAAATTIDKITHDAIGASYNFGPATAHVMTTKLKYKDATATDTGNIKSTLVGVTVPLGVVSIRASISQGEINDNGVETYDVDGFQVVARYDLSKRTHAYFAAGQTKYDSPAANSDVKIKQMGIGLRHSF